MAIENFRIGQGSHDLVEEVLAMEKLMSYYGVDGTDLWYANSPLEIRQRSISDLTDAHSVDGPEERPNIDNPDQVEGTQKSLIFF